MPLKTFKFPRFKAGVPLIEQMSAERLNAMLDAIEASQVQFGLNLVGTRTSSGTIIRADDAYQPSVHRRDPFQLLRGFNKVAQLPMVRVWPGFLNTVVVPMLAGVPLTDFVPDERGNPAPPGFTLTDAMVAYDEDGDPESQEVWLKVNFTGATTNVFRVRVTDAQVELHGPDDEDADQREPFLVTWEPPDGWPPDCPMWNIWWLQRST